MMRHGEVSNEPQLHAMLRAIADARHIARRTIDDIAGLTPGHTEKLLAQVPLKRIGMDTLFPLAWALGVRIVLEDDPANLARIADLVNGKVMIRDSASRGSMRVKTAAVLAKHAARQVSKQRQQLSRLGNEARTRKLSKRRRRSIARHAAITRHKRERAARAAARNAPGPISKAAKPEKLATPHRKAAKPTAATTSSIVRCCEMKRDAITHPSAAQRRPADSEHQRGAKRDEAQTNRLSHE